MPKAFKYLLNTFLIATLAAGGYFAYIYHNEILDWYYLRDYKPPAEVATLADQAGMTDQARRLFYRTRPQIDMTKPELVRDCMIKGEKTLELGCYISTNNIYVFNISDPDLKTEMTVTAGHEMLHAVYQRMGLEEKRRINAELEAVAAGITDPKFHERMAEYERTQPGSRANELHSILGTEYPNLTPELEAHYAKYFQDRSQIVSYSQQFDKTFDGLHAEIVQLDGAISARRQTMDQYLARGQVAAYNSLVPVINNDIAAYNQKVERYNQYARELLGQENAAGTQ